MKKLLLICLICLFACSEDEAVIPACDVANPAENLPWLKSKIDDYFSQGSDIQDQFAYVAQSLYNGETVFIFSNCCPYCSTMPQLSYY